MAPKLSKAVRCLMEQPAVVGCGTRRRRGCLWEDDVVVAKVFSVVAEGTAGGGGGDAAPRAS